MTDPLPKGLSLLQFFGDHFYDFRRAGERGQQIIELVEERRSMKRCDLCGLPMKEAPKSPKEMVGAYVCDYCRRQLQS